MSGFTAECGVFLELLTEVAQSIYSSEQTLQAICRIFEAKSGCLWEVNRQSGAEVFFLTAMHNRPDLESVIEMRSKGRRRQYQIKFDIGRGNTVSTRIFRDRSSVSGIIGREPFHGDWLKKEHTSGLEGLGIGGIALIPVFGSGGEPLASLSLYFQDAESLPSTEFLNSFSNHFSSLWENSHMKVDDLRLEKSLLRHEIVGDIIVLKSAADKLERLLERVVPEDRLVNTDQIFSDVKAKIVSIEATLSDSGIFDRAYINRTINSFVDLREMINETAQPLISKLDRRRISLSNVYYPRGGIEIRMHPTDLGHIIRNIVENALKYSTHGSTIKVEVMEQSGVLSLTVSNISPRMDESEWTAIWGARVRGRRQASADTTGTGLGLYVVKQICKIYDLEYKFWQDEMQRENEDLAWSRVRVSFPRNRVR